MADARKLKDEALDASAHGNWKKAASLYASLEQQENDPLWPLKLGECLRKLGHPVEAIKALSRAVDLYAKSDLLLKAIAVCKIILEIDPGHTRTQQMLASLHGSRREAQTRAPEPAPTPPPAPAPLPPDPTALAWAPAAHVRGASGGARRSELTPPPATTHLAPLVPEIPSGTNPRLLDLNLARLMPGARPSTQVASQDDGAAHEIPLEITSVKSQNAPAPTRRRGPRTLARFALPKTPFFSVLTEDQLRMAIDRVRLIQLAEGEILFAMGDPGKEMYVVAEGEIAVLVPQEIARLQEGDFFGEVSLLVNQPRNTTARATMPTQVLVLDRPLVRDLISVSPAVLKVLLRFLRERLIATLAETSPMFAPFSEGERALLTSKFRFLEVDRNVRVIEQGQPVSGLFVLLAGEAAAVTGGQPVAHYKAGELFGEMALIHNLPATATVVALQKSYLLHMPSKDFGEVIMTHPQVLEYLGTLAHHR
jgi:cAMP-dependent protein kinase regulator